MVVSGNMTPPTASGGFYSELRYMPWGGNRYTAGTTPTSFRYTGQRESEVGLYFYGARFYDPALGRFVSPDTIIPQGQGSQAWDRYAGMNNNPVRYTDPTGHGVTNDDGGCTSYADCHPDHAARILLFIPFRV
jgi:RHS repeat-associated protein